MNLVVTACLDAAGSHTNAFSVRVQCYPILVFRVERIITRDLRTTLQGLLHA